METEAQRGAGAAFQACGPNPTPRPRAPLGPVGLGGQSGLLHLARRPLVAIPSRLLGSFGFSSRPPVGCRQVASLIQQVALVPGGPGKGQSWGQRVEPELTARTPSLAPSASGAASFMELLRCLECTAPACGAAVCLPGPGEPGQLPPRLRPPELDTQPTALGHAGAQRACALGWRLRLRLPMPGGRTASQGPLSLAGPQGLRLCVRSRWVAPSLRSQGGNEPAARDTPASVTAGRARPGPHLLLAPARALWSREPQCPPLCPPRQEHRAERGPPVRSAQPVPLTRASHPL